MNDIVNIWCGNAEMYNTYRPQPQTTLLDICTQLTGNDHPHLVVDLGSGTGLSTMLWASKAHQVIGIEPNADMRHQAIQQATTMQVDHCVTFREGLSTQTNLPTQCADVVTCSQALHWMEPGPTFAEVARILRPGGLFAIYDYDWPPTTHWEIHAAYHCVIDHIEHIRNMLPGVQGRHWLDKQYHLERMKASKKFRFLTEVAFHRIEEGTADRFLGLMMTWGIRQFILQQGCTDQDIGFDSLQDTVHRVFGAQSRPWYWSYRLRAGIL